MPGPVLYVSAATAALKDPSAICVELLTLVRKRKEWTREDMFTELLQTRAGLDCAQRSWRMNIAYSLEKGRSDRRNAQESHHEKE